MDPCALQKLVKTSEETRLAIARRYVPTYHVAGAGRSNGKSAELNRDHTGRQKALGSGSADNLKTPAPDGRLKQWFLDDLAGSHADEESNQSMETKESPLILDEQLRNSKFAKPFDKAERRGYYYTQIPRIIKQKGIGGKELTSMNMDKFRHFF